MVRLSESVKSVLNVAAANRTAAGDTDGAAVDTLGYDAVQAVVVGGTIGAASALDVKLQHSNTTTAGDFEDIAGAAIVQLTATPTGVPIIDVRLGGRANRRRYVRARLTTTGTGGVAAGVILNLYQAESEPVTQTVTPVIV